MGNGERHASMRPAPRRRRFRKDTRPKPPRGSSSALDDAARGVSDRGLGDGGEALGRGEQHSGSRVVQGEVIRIEGRVPESEPPIDVSPAREMPAKEPPARALMAPPRERTREFVRREQRLRDLMAAGPSAAELEAEEERATTERALQWAEMAETVRRPLTVQIPTSVRQWAGMGNAVGVEYLIQYAAIIETLVPLLPVVDTFVDAVEATTGRSWLLQTELTAGERALAAAGLGIVLLIPLAGKIRRLPSAERAIARIALRVGRDDEHVAETLRRLDRLAPLRGAIEEGLARYKRGERLTEEHVAALRELREAMQSLETSAESAAEGRRLKSPDIPDIPESPPDGRPHAGPPSGSTAIQRRNPSLRLVQMAATGLNMHQLEAASRILGANFRSGRVARLGAIWDSLPETRRAFDELAAMIQARRSTAEVQRRARRLFDGVRSKFWKAVVNDDEARGLIESMGASFLGKPGTAPKLPILSRGRIVWHTIDVDHLLELGRRPNLAFSSHNLRLSLARENRVVLNQLQRLDLFQREGQIIRSGRRLRRPLVTPN